MRTNKQCKNITLYEDEPTRSPAFPSTYHMHFKQHDGGLTMERDKRGRGPRPVSCTSGSRRIHATPTLPCSGHSDDLPAFSPLPSHRLLLPPSLRLLLTSPFPTSRL